MVVRSHRIIVSWECRFGYNIIHASFRQNGEVSSGMAKRECFGEGGGSCEGG